MNKLQTILKKIQNPKDILFTISMILLFAILNLLFSWFNNVILKSPVFMDSIFTAVSAVLLGSPWAVLTGLLTNLGQEAIYGFNGLYWPFAICNISTGFIVGLMDKKNFFEKGSHITITILLVTLSNAVLGSMTAFLFLNGDSGVQVDQIVSALTETGFSLVSATFWARIPSNLIDKMITVYAAYGIKKLISSKF